jgi:hypothetical protein
MGVVKKKAGGVALDALKDCLTSIMRASIGLP